MKTIIIDENYEGIYKCDGYYRIDMDICFPNVNIEIKIPLVSSKSIVGKSLKVEGPLYVGEWIEVGGWIEVGEWLEVGEYLSVGEWLKVERWLEVGDWLKIGASLSIFGEKTTKYALLALDTYQVILTTNFIKIGCQVHKVEEWQKYKDKQISAMDGQKALDWWKTWKEFILSTHKNLPETFKS